MMRTIKGACYSVKRSDDKNYQGVPIPNDKIIVASNYAEEILNCDAILESQADQDLVCERGREITTSQANKGAFSRNALMMRASAANAMGCVETQAAWSLEATVPCANCLRQTPAPTGTGSTVPSEKWIAV